MGARRSRIVVLSVLLLGLSLPFLGLGALDLLRNRAEQKAMPDPPRPDGVADDAVFRGGLDGGFFIRLRRDDFLLGDGRHLPAYHLTVWHSFDGSIEYDGPAIFVSDRGMDADGNLYTLQPPAEPAILQTADFNGTELRFDIEGHSRFGRIIPVAVPD